MINIRSATAEDIDFLLELNRQIGDVHYENEPTVFLQPSPEEKEFLLKAVNDSERIFLVAENNQKVIGFITATISKNDVIPFINKDPVCRVGTIVVHEKYRSSGVGKKLMSKCTDWAISSGAKSIRLEVMEFNEKAQSFYNELGFRTQSRIMSSAISG